MNARVVVITRLPIIDLAIIVITGSLMPLFWKAELKAFRIVKGEKSASDSGDFDDLIKISLREAKSGFSGFFGCKYNYYRFS